MIVVDSSAVIAMMFGEPESDHLAGRLADEPIGQRVMSVANYLEAGTVLAGRQTQPVKAPAMLENFINLCGIELRPVNAAQARMALDARIQFGRGFGAKAGLNFGDCFAASHQRPCKCLKAWSSFRADGFTGEHGLIKENISFKQFNIRRNDATKR